MHRTAGFSRHDLSSVEGLCVTSVTRTLVDLCVLGNQGLLAATLDEALRRRKTTVDRLQAALSTAAYRRGVGMLRALVDEQLGGTTPTESELEARVVELLASAGFPQTVRQQTIHVGGRVRRMNFHVRGTPVVIEADGYAYHSSLRTFESDRARNNELTARGLRVLHWTWAAVRDRPEELLGELRQTLKWHRQVTCSPPASLLKSRAEKWTRHVQNSPVDVVAPRLESSAREPWTGSQAETSRHPPKAELDRPPAEHLLPCGRHRASPWERWLRPDRP